MPNRASVERPRAAIGACAPRRRQLLALAAIVTATAAATPAISDESWNPFREKDEAARAKKQARPAEAERPLLAPMGGVVPGQGAGQTQPAISASPARQAATSADPSQPWQAPVPVDPAARAGAARIGNPGEVQRGIDVERGDLAPALAGDSSGLPQELWSGFDLAKLKAQISQLELPPRSPAVHQLWRRLLLAETPPAGTDRKELDAIRLELMTRSGLIGDARAIADRVEAGAAHPAASLLKARTLIAAGDHAAGCAAQSELTRSKQTLPEGIAGEALLLAGYCAAKTGNPGAAGLSAELAREQGVEAPLALAALDAAAAGGGQPPSLPKRLSALDYRYLALAGRVDPAQLLDRADAGMLATLALDAATEPRLRVAAAEGAARLNAIGHTELADAYRAAPAQPDAGDPLTSRADPLLRRAGLVRALETERTALRRARIIRALLDDGRRSGLYLPLLRLVAKPAGELRLVPEIGWFAETAIEAQIAAGELERARQSVLAARDVSQGDGLSHWLALIDIADANLSGPRGTSLPSVEQLALRGRFGADLLHRLATVLDALDYNVPIPLWDAANRAPQPAGGHLPPTGVLSELQEAAKRKEAGRAILLVMRSVGPNGAEGAHLIALGDAIRALRRSGLDADARRLGVEALFGGWPRTPG